MERRTLSLAETAKLLGLHQCTTRRLVKLGVLPGVKLGRKWFIPVESFDKLLQSASKTDGGENKQ